MSKLEITERKVGNDYVRTITDTQTGKSNEIRIPLYLENGKPNPELLKFIKADREKAKVNDTLYKAPKTSKIMEPTEIDETEEEIDAEEIENEIEDEIEDEESENFGRKKIVKEDESKNHELLKKGLKALGLVTAGALIAACLLKGCGKEEAPAQNVAVVQEIEVENLVEEKNTPTLDELKSDSRYTEITEDMFRDTTNNLIEEFADHGIEITGQDAMNFVAVANITHLEQTNPELLAFVFGENPDAEEILTSAGHIIGQIVTIEVTDKDEQVNWTIAFMDETDKKIADDNVLDVIEGSRVIVNNPELTEEEKGNKIRENINENYIAPNFDKTIGYTFADGTSTKLSQEDGADFITDAIVTGVLIGDNKFKNYTYNTETGKDLEAISYNEDNVSNIMTMIEDCDALSQETSETLEEVKVKQ